MAKRILPLASGVKLAASKDANELLADQSNDVNQLFQMFSRNEISKECYIKNAERVNSGKPKRVENPFESAEEFLGCTSQMVLTGEVIGLDAKGKAVKSEVKIVCRAEKNGTGSYGFNMMGPVNCTVGGRECSLYSNIKLTVQGSKPKSR